MNGQTEQGRGGGVCGHKIIPKRHCETSISLSGQPPFPAVSLHVVWCQMPRGRREREAATTGHTTTPSHPIPDHKGSSLIPSLSLPKWRLAFSSLDDVHRKSKGRARLSEIESDHARRDSPCSMDSRDWHRIWCLGDSYHKQCTS